MIDHVSCTVKDLDRSCHFYMTLFGLRVIREWKRDEAGLRAKVLGTEDRGLLEIIESTSAIMPRATPPRDFVAIVSKAGFTHLSFAVRDMTAALAELARLGGKVIDGPKTGITVKSFAFVQDPDGIVIELVELHDGNGRASGRV